MFNTVTAQLPGYGLVATCFDCGYSGPNSIHFRIYLWSSDSSYFEYSGGQFCFEVDTSFSNGGELTYQLLSSDLPANLRPENPTVIRSGKHFLLNLERNDIPDPGNGYNLTGRAIYIGSMKITTTAPSLKYEDRLSMNWRTKDGNNHSTNIFSYVNMINTEITNPDRHEMDFILPVELSYLSSNVNRNIVTLNWSTTYEINNSGY